jgi:hypothetical protein
MGLVDCVDKRMGEVRNERVILVGKLERKRLLQRCGHRWEKNIKFGLNRLMVSTGLICVGFKVLTAVTILIMLFGLVGPGLVRFKVWTGVEFF